jgi:endoglucanase
MRFQKRVHRRVFLSGLVALSVASCGGGGGGGSPAPSPTPTPAPTPAPAPTLAAVTTADLGTGWNLGNALDAVNGTGIPHAASQETFWGNAAVNQQLFDAVAAAGFKSVRIPVTWYQYADATDTIAPFWLARVKAVVDMARTAGLYVIINQHHENWLTPTTANQAAANARMTKFWTQIATYFKDYDNRLLFAGTNEILFPGDYGPPTAEYCTVQTGFNQAFVDAVRATGGNNASRMLVVQGFNTNVDHTIDNCGAKVPTDTATGRLMMELHYYSPFNFALNDQSAIWQWGASAVDPAATETWANEAYVDSQMLRLKVTYGDKGIPVIIGEYGAIAKTEFDPAMTYRNLWIRYFSDSARRHGIAPFYWDNGYPDNHQFGLFNRSTGAQYYPATIKAIFNLP